ncbi:MAG: hypothetical protein Sapg2KO_50240 [Saprospiraceae bacterium]
MKKKKTEKLMIIGNFDFVAIGILVAINILIWRKEIKSNIGCLIGGLIFGLILPIISQKLEIDRVTSEREVLDNFTLLYTYYKFPIYWVIGAIQIAIISKKEDNEKNKIDN